MVITEIGGTVGDIESTPFLESIRQVMTEVGRENAISIHVTLVPFIAGSNELKSKPTQHSVKELLSLGIQPNILVCRSESEIPEAQSVYALYENKIEELKQVSGNDDFTRVLRIVRDLTLEGRPYTADEVVARFRTPHRDATVLAFLRGQITRLTAEGRLGTARNYARTLNSFSDFLGGADLPFAALTEPLVEEYSAYLMRTSAVSMWG